MTTQDLSFDLPPGRFRIGGQFRSRVNPVTASVRFVKDDVPGNLADPDEPVPVKADLNIFPQGSNFRGNLASKKSGLARQVPIEVEKMINRKWYESRSPSNPILFIDNVNVADKPMGIRTVAECLRYGVEEPGQIQVVRVLPSNYVARGSFESFVDRIRLSLVRFAYPV